MTILDLLTQLLGAYKTQNREYLFGCPFCHNKKHKFSVNLEKNAFHCWHCGAKGRSLITLFKRLDVSPSQMKELRGLLSEDQIRNYKEDKDTKTDLYLPPSFKRLWVPDNTLMYRHAVSYLKKRGISGYDIIRYQMGYTTDGPYANRIIIPSYDANNKLNYFIARAFFDGGMKYKNPPVSKNVVMFENQINWDMPIVLVEGAFDAIAVRRNAIPVLGKTLPNKLLRALIKNDVREVYIALDNDAESAAMDMERTLTTHEIDVKLVKLGDKDPSVLGFHETWNYIEKAESTTFKNYLNGRLQNI